MQSCSPVQRTAPLDDVAAMSSLRRLPFLSRILPLLALLLILPTLSLAEASHDATLWVSLRRAFAPTSSTGRVISQNPAAVLSATHSSKEFSRGQPWLNRAFAPSSLRAAEKSSRATAETKHKTKMSRVSVDKMAVYPILPQSVRGGMDSVQLHTDCVESGTQVSNVKSKRDFHSPQLAFMGGDAVVGSRGCSRDWNQLVKSEEQKMLRRSSGRLSRLSSPTGHRTFRLSRTVEVAECPHFQPFSAPASRRAMALAGR
mmetsp:Transcript_48133/g.70573  ORF Transcript_48133/g.70573 Transcript_48133/m.70573 type:complete len:258 (+) Transcript_48133:230-1003(+)